MDTDGPPGRQDAHVFRCDDAVSGHERDPATGRWVHQWGIVARNRPGEPTVEVAHCQTCGAFEDSHGERYRTVGALRAAFPSLNVVDTDTDFWADTDSPATTGGAGPADLPARSVTHEVSGLGTVTLVPSGCGRFRGEVFASAAGDSAGIIYERDPAKPTGWNLRVAYGWTDGEMLDMVEQVTAEVRRLEASAPAIADGPSGGAALTDLT